MTHWRPGSDRPRSIWAEGSAMFMMVRSRPTMSWATATAARAHQRRVLTTSPAVAATGVSVAVMRTSQMLSVDGAGGQQGAGPPAGRARRVFARVARQHWLAG